MNGGANFTHLPVEERRRQGAAQLAGTKADLHQALNPQTLQTRHLEIISAIEFVVVGVVSDGNPDVAPGTPAHLLDDPTKIRVEFTSGPGAVQQQREREEELRRKAASAAAQRARQIQRAAGPSTWFEAVGDRLAAVKSATTSSVGSIVLMRDRVRETCDVLDWMVATSTNSPRARAFLAQLSNDCSSAVYPSILRDRMRSLIDCVELLLFNEISDGEPRVDAGTPLAEIEDVTRPKVVFGPIGRAASETRPEVSLIDRDSRTVAPALVELTMTPPLNATQRVEYLDAKGRRVDESGKPIEVVTAAQAPAVTVEPPKLVEESAEEPEAQLIEPPAVESAIVAAVVEPAVVEKPAVVEPKREVGEGVRSWP
jgi:hypothetical protein